MKPSSTASLEKGLTEKRHSFSKNLAVDVVSTSLGPCQVRFTDVLNRPEAVLLELPCFSGPQWLSSYLEYVSKFPEEVSLQWPRATFIAKSLLQKVVSVELVRQCRLLRAHLRPTRSEPAF